MNGLSPESLALLIARYAGPLALYARQWCAASDDVVQEALLQLARQRVVPDDPPAWLYRAVRNGAISAGRSDARRRRRERETATERDEWFQAAGETEIETADDAAKAVAALERLEPDLRETLTAHLWGGLTFEQIAELTGTSAATAHRRYRQGLEQLRAHWEQPCKTTRN